MRRATRCRSAPSSSTGTQLDRVHQAADGSAEWIEIADPRRQQVGAKLCNVCRDGRKHGRRRGIGEAKIGTATPRAIWHSNRERAAVGQREHLLLPSHFKQEHGAGDSFAIAPAVEHAIAFLLDGSDQAL